MLPNLKNRVGAKSLQLLMCASLALALAACGGGGGSPGATGGGTGTGTGTGTNTAEPTVTMTVTDGSGAAINTLSGGQKATLKATVLDAAGKPAVGEIVTFSVGDSALLVLEQASALTDSSGVAVNRANAATITSVGATTISATTVIKTRTATVSKNIAVGAAPLSISKVEFASPPPSPLPAFSTASLNITINSGTQPATSVTGLSLTSLCVSDGTATLVAGPLAGGIQAATYTNKGCLRLTDVITVAVGNSSQTISLPVGAANIGTIQFVGSDLAGSSIVLKGSGGLGRKEAALLTFRVIDQNNNGLAGVNVSFKATTNTGGLTVAPDKGTTDANGNVTTTVSSGTIPTPVRVIAEATRNGVTISGLSDALVISTGLPIQRNMSLSFDTFNLAALNTDGIITTATVRLADQYGNPISDGTAVNFVTEGGAIGTSSQGACTTVNGKCTVELSSQNFRPANGRVSVLAYVQGLEDFVDANGDGQYTCSAWQNQVAGVPFRPLVDVCTTGESWSDMGDPFLDTGKAGVTAGVPAVSHSFDFSYDATLGDKPFPYNHVGYVSAGDGHWGLNYIRAQSEVTFSGSDPVFTRQVYDTVTDPLKPVWRDWIVAKDGALTNMYVLNGLSGAGCSTKEFRFRLADVNNNPLPKDTSVGTSDSDKVIPTTMSPNKVASTNAIGGTVHSVLVKPDSACVAGRFSVSITTSGGTVLIPIVAP